MPWCGDRAGQADAGLEAGGGGLGGAEAAHRGQKTLYGWVWSKPQWDGRRRGGLARGGDGGWCGTPPARPPRAAAGELQEDRAAVSWRHSAPGCVFPGVVPEDPVVIHGCGD